MSRKNKGRFPQETAFIFFEKISFKIYFATVIWLAITSPSLVSMV